MVVGRVGKPHGVRGEVLLHPGSADMSVFEPGRSFDTELGLFTVARTRRHHGAFIILFEGVTSREEAETLRGLAFRTSADAVRLDAEEWWPSDLVSCQAVTTDGMVLGEIVDVVSGTAQDRLLIRTPSGVDVEVPFVKDLVPGVDPGARRVVINPPEGLFPVP